jgi:TetR/AcrR family transcriptional repressor of nem operon
MSEKALQYDIALIRNLKAINALNGDPDVEQLARLMSQFIQGVLTYGRIFASLDMVRTDLREGLYRILDLKEEYRVIPQDAELAASV